MHLIYLILLLPVVKGMNVAKLDIKDLNIQLVSKIPARTYATTNAAALPVVADEASARTLAGDSSFAVIPSGEVPPGETETEVFGFVRAILSGLLLSVSRDINSAEDLINSDLREKARAELIQKLLGADALRREVVQQLYKFDQNGNLEIDRMQLRLGIAFLAAQAVKTAA